jgi:putative acetyltransferase
MEIRRYQRGEEGAIWEVYFEATHRSIGRDYHADLVERWAPRDRGDKDKDEWAERLREKNPFVAIEGGRIVGMAEIEGDGTEGFVDYFYVHPDWQGKGIGKALLARLEGEAVNVGAKVIFADVSVTAKGFFLEQGFVVTEAKANVILGHPAPNFRMEKRVTR